MKCNLLCTYNKRNKLFKWKYCSTYIKDLDDVWHQLTSYFEVPSKRKIIISGFEACCQYLKDIKEAVENYKIIDKDNLQPFFDFKEHIKNLLYDICYQGYIMTGPGICDDYVSLFDECEKEYHSDSINMVKLIELFERLHIEERILIGKMYGMKKIKNAK